MWQLQRRVSLCLNFQPMKHISARSLKQCSNHTIETEPTKVQTDSEAEPTTVADWVRAVNHWMNSINHDHNNTVLYNVYYQMFTHTLHSFGYLSLGLISPWQVPHDLQVHMAYYTRAPSTVQESDQPNSWMERTSFMVTKWCLFNDDAINIGGLPWRCFITGALDT